MVDGQVLVGQYVNNFNFAKGEKSTYDLNAAFIVPVHFLF